MIEKFVGLIPNSVLSMSGSVFYSGRVAFSNPSKVYILGLNPGGSPVAQSAETVAWHSSKVLHHEPDDWSAYRDVRWQGNPPGTYGMQPRVLHLLRGLERDPGRVPSSNVVFVRTAREKDLDRDFSALAKLCWPFHQSVIDTLGVRVILCFGRKAGRWVIECLKAKDHIDKFVENNNRRWKSDSYRNRDGMKVVVATHPSIADWTSPATDPTALVRRMLEAE